MSCKIGLLGDVMLGRGVADRLQSVNPEQVWAPELIEIASSLDLVVCNLECCISNRGRPTNLLPDKPFFFRAPRSAVGSLAAIGTAAVGLANNHALDFGAEALSDTIDHLGAAKIAVAGAGADLDEARRGVIVERPFDGQDHGELVAEWLSGAVDVHADHGHGERLADRLVGPYVLAVAIT